MTKHCVILFQKRQEEDAEEIKNRDDVIKKSPDFATMQNAGLFFKYYLVSNSRA